MLLLFVIKPSWDMYGNVGDMFQTLKLFIFGALPVPMLRQVYVKPCAGPSWAPLGFAWAPPGPPGAPKKCDFAWEVCKKWQDGDVKRTC